MGRPIHKLSNTRIAKLKDGMHGDGGGLYLRIVGNGRSWIFRFARDGRSHDLGVGPFPEVSLTDARARAFEFRQALARGVDPLVQKREQHATARAETAKAMTFDECAQAYIRAHDAKWSNAKHRRQWSDTLRVYASPVFGSLLVSAIDTRLVMRAIEPLWKQKAETASRVRARIEAVLGWATVSGFRSGDNPARWRGHLDHLLPARSDVAPVEHHAALPWSEAPAFMARLRTEQGSIARALEFAILTGMRREAVALAAWPEVDLQSRVWTVPAARMKGRQTAKKDHRVPLSERAIEIVQEMAAMRTCDLIFPGRDDQRPIGEAGMRQLCQRLDATITPHGFRSTFRDWAAESTNFPREVAEQALAHTISNKVEAAYRRGDLFEKRRRLMQTWAEFCAKPSVDGDVVPLKRAVRS
jgi:integrase